MELAARMVRPWTESSAADEFVSFPSSRQLSNRARVQVDLRLSLAILQYSNATFEASIAVRPYTAYLILRLAPFKGTSYEHITGMLGCVGPAQLGSNFCIIAYQKGAPLLEFG